MDRIRNKLRSVFEASQEVNPAWKKINKSMADLHKEFPNSDLVKSAQAVVSAQQLHIEDAVKMADEVTARLLDPKKTTPIDLLNNKEEAGFITHNVLLAYRITRRPEKIQEFFTLAWNHPMRGKTDLPNQKHIGQQLFGAYIRTNDLAQQRTHASKLFQAFKEERYMFWSLVALALSIQSEGPSAQLEIVQRFIEGQIKKDKATAQDLALYLQLLQQQHKHSEVISTVRADYAAKLMPLAHERDLTLAHAHVKMQQHAEAMQLYQQLIDTHSADEWQYFTGYLDALLTRVTDVTDALLTRTRDWLAALQSTHGHYRAPYLAHLELETRVLVRFAGPAQHAVVSALITDYFKRFSHRPSCWRDLRMYVAALLDTAHVTPCLATCRTYCAEVKAGLSGVSAEDTRALPSHIDVLTRELNLVALELVVQFNSAEHSAQQLLYAPAALWELWQQAVKLPIKVAPSERHPGDDAATYLAWLVAYAGSQRDDTNTLRTALAILKRALAVSPHNFEFKYLATMLYAALGAAPAAFTLFKELEVKHMQYDTLSHLVFDRLLDFAAYNEAEHVIAKIIAFHDDNKKTTPEYVLEAYKNGTYAKVGELMAFERRLSRSIQLVKAQQAQLMVSYLKSCNSLTESLHFFADCETLICKDLPHQLADIRALTCNYDATVLFEWDLDAHRVMDPRDPVLTVRSAADDWRVYVQAHYLRVLLHFHLANKSVIKSLAPAPAPAKAPTRGGRPSTVPSSESAALDESHVAALSTALATLHRALIDAQLIPADTVLHAVTPVSSDHASVTPVQHTLRGLTEYTLGTAQFAAQDSLIWRTVLANYDAYLVLNQFIAALSTGGEDVDCATLIGKVKAALATLRTLLADAWGQIKQSEKELSKFAPWLRLVNKYLALVLQSARMSFTLLNHTYPARLKKGSDELKAAYTATKDELKTLSALIETQLTRDLPALLESTKQFLSTLAPAAVSDLQNSVVDLPDLLHENHKRHVQDACEPVLDSYRSVIFQLLDILKFKKTSN